MKKNNIFCVILLLFFAISTTSCSSPVNDAVDLYGVMLDHSTYLKSRMDDYYKMHTKSDAEWGPLDGTIYGGDKVSNKFYDYIDQYIEPDNVLEWDESFILGEISSDSRFSDDEKIMMAKALSLGYLLKTELGPISTKVSESDCLRAFNKAIKRATRNAALGMIAALLEPTLVAELIVVVLYYEAIDDAEEDYNDCIASIE